MSEININNLAKKVKAIFDDDEDACIITKLSSYKSLIITASSNSSGFFITLEEHITDDDDDTRYIKIMSDDYSPSFLNLVIKEYLGRGGNPNLEPDNYDIYDPENIDVGDNNNDPNLEPDNYDIYDPENIDVGDNNNDLNSQPNNKTRITGDVLNFDEDGNVFNINDVEFSALNNGEDVEFSALNNGEDSSLDLGEINDEDSSLEVKDINVPSSQIPSKVLVVEPHSELRTILVQRLREDGHFAAAVGSVAEAVDLCRDEEPDLLVCVEILEQNTAIRLAQELGCAVIVLTTRSEQESLVNLFDEGADDVLIKPFGVEELAARCRTLLKRGKIFFTLPTSTNK